MRAALSQAINAAAPFNRAAHPPAPPAPPAAEAAGGSASDPGRDRAFAGFIMELVALATGVRAHEIAAPTRLRSDAARARQIAMYLAHTQRPWPLARVGYAFGRDRSTAAHACKRVEDWREEPGFDRDLRRLEACVRAAPDRLVRL